MSYSSYINGNDIASKISTLQFQGKQPTSPIRPLHVSGSAFTVEYEHKEGQSHIFDFNAHYDKVFYVTKLPEQRSSVRMSKMHFQNAILLDDGSIYMTPFQRNRKKKNESILSVPVEGSDPQLYVTQTGYAVLNENRLVYFDSQLRVQNEVELSHSPAFLLIHEGKITTVSQDDSSIVFRNYSPKSLLLNEPTHESSIDGHLTATGIGSTLGHAWIGAHNGVESIVAHYNGTQPNKLTFELDLGDYAQHHDDAQNSISAIAKDSIGNPILGMANGLVFTRSQPDLFQPFAAVGSPVHGITDYKGWKMMSGEDGALVWHTEKTDGPVQLQPQFSNKNGKKAQPKKPRIVFSTDGDSIQKMGPFKPKHKRR